MKFKISALLIGLLAFMSSCDDLSLINYDLNFATVAMTIDATENPDTSYILESGLIDPKGELEKNGVSSDLIKKATIKSVTINLESPSTGNFNWVKSAKVFIIGENSPEKEVATVSEVPDDQKSIEQGKTEKNLEINSKVDEQKSDQ